jgi:hypothetical protein
MGESLTARGVRTAVRWHVHGAAQNRRRRLDSLPNGGRAEFFALPIRGRTKPFAYVGAHRQPPDRYLKPLVSRSIFTFLKERPDIPRTT